jgi:purine-binding chemotaxis protein CheW
MINQENAIGERARTLRREFDDGFARAPGERGGPTEAFLAIEVAGDAYALRLAQVAGLYADRRVIALPGEVRELLGLANFRGTLIPIYDLRVLLGYPPGPPPRWLVLAASSTPVGLAFDRFERHLTLSEAEVVHEGAPDARRQSHPVEALQIGERPRKIIDLHAMVESISQRVQAGNATKEQ